MINLNSKPNEYFNEIFDSISASAEVRTVFSIVEYIASIEHSVISIDHIISAILYYYRDKDPGSVIIRLYPADEYFSKIKNNLKISFSDFANEKPVQIYKPSTNSDVDRLFLNLYDYQNMLITVPLLMYVICDVCKKEESNLQKLPFICEDKYKFDTLYTYLNAYYQVTYAYTQEMLVDCGTDMTFKAAQNKYDKIIGRDNELNQLLQILCKRTKNNAILVGNPGVGKTHIVEALAKLFTLNKVPKKLIGKKIISLSITELVSGTEHRGDFEAKLQDFMGSISSKSAIIFIDEIHTICTDNSHDSGSLGNMLKPYLLNPDFSIIGATTPKEYRLIEKDPALARRFDVIHISEPTVCETIQILLGLKSIYEDFHSVTISDEVIENCVKLSDRYIYTSSLPDKALDVLDEACAKLECDFSTQGKNLLTKDICEIITKRTGIPIHTLNNANNVSILNLESALKSKIIGQDKAIDTIVCALKRATLDLQDINKPIASFLFAGTTGVGKTETAKLLAHEYFNDSKAFIRLDMSEYSTKETVSRLTGSPPGYVGYNEGGQLTNAVKNCPYSIVLFDEIEKAHPDVLNILLQILDDGRLTDNTGLTVNFKNTIIILTTNIGAKAVQTESVGFENNITTADCEKTVISEIKKALKPELINRLNNIIVYSFLTKADCEKIVRLYLADFKSKLNKKGISLTYSPILSKKITEHGYNELYGARELKRTFDKMVVDNVTDLILTKNAKSINIDFSLNFSILRTKHNSKFE